MQSIPLSAPAAPCRSGTGARAAHDTCAAILASGTEERVGELERIERDEIARALPHADDLHRETQLLLDHEHDAALRGAVELREHDPRDVDRVRELTRLHEPVLAGRSVD